MSQGYAIDFYGKTTYGYSQPADYSVTPFTATQTGYNSLTLNWVSPNATPWKTMQLVSSLYGYPTTPADGTLRLVVDGSVSITSFDDLNLLPGRIYYYTIFLNTESPTWSSGTTYETSNVVLYSGQYWVSIQDGNIGNTPVVGSAFWANTQPNNTWFPAGYTASLVVNDFGYSQHLYDRTPQPYKIVASDIFTNAVVDNPQLFHYLSIFGFFLDMTKTEYNLYLQGNNPDVIAAANLDWLGRELGVATDFLASPQLRRNRVDNAATNYRLKGTLQGIHNAIAEITGWDSAISYSSNMMLSNDQAAFYHPQYEPWNNSITYFANQLVQFNGYDYKCLTQAFGSAQAPTGSNTSNTWWSPQVSTTTTPLTDAVTLKNPFNSTATAPRFSTWAPNPALGKLNGVYLGLPHPTNSSIKNWHALSLQLQSAPTGNDLFAYGVGAPAITVWTNSTNYVVNNFVSTNSGANFWMAIKPSGPGTPYGFITPGTNETFWKPIPVPASGLPAKYNWIKDSIPIQHTRIWDSASQYSMGDRIVYFGIIYEAVRTNTNSAPSGYYYHNADWIFIQPSDFVYTVSGYEARITTNTSNQTAFADITFIDDQLNTNPSFDLTSTNTFLTNYLSRFIVDYTDLNTVNDNTLTSLNRPWSSATGLWKSNYGMASVNQTVAGTNTYSPIFVNMGLADLTLSITFVTDYVDPIHYGGGILFRYQDANNFWYVTRKSLYKVVAGVETLKASWTRLNNGDRILVQTLANAITVTAYKRDGSGGTNPLAFVTDTDLQFAVRHGMIQKYSPSGAV